MLAAAFLEVEAESSALDVVEVDESDPPLFLPPFPFVVVEVEVADEVVEVAAATFVAAEPESAVAVTVTVD